MFAKVIIEYPIKSLDKCFSYKVPNNLEYDIKIGSKVVVPFGNQILNGVVLDLNDIVPGYETKEICRLKEENPLTREQIEIGKFMQEKTLCTLISAYQTMLPPCLKVNFKSKKLDAFDKYILLNEDDQIIENYIDSHKRSIKQIDIINELRKGKMLKKHLNCQSLETLIKNNIVIEEKINKRRIEYNGPIAEKKPLNSEQKVAYEIVKNKINEFGIFLLQGVTGSGKTEVYMHLIEDVILNDKSVIVLVPEICLTTQTVKRFYNRFGNNVAVFHSGLSDGEKYDEYQKIYNDEVNIVVGTRSSIFVPLKNLGLIIIDEEHSETYKQENNPRYTTLDIAEFRAKYHNIPLLLASATPSLESRARADKKVYQLLTLNKRANNHNLPETTIVDMTKEISKRNYILSEELQKKISEKLTKKEQSIILLNRRGFSTFINCTNCGFVYKCPNCDITLTYHKTSNNLRCHYCGYYTTKDDCCPNCHENSLNYLGLGTQKLEEELHKLYPNARIIRMDQDTTTKKWSYQKIIDDFADYKYDILLGTQMISKGLDFKNVTLVGIINADTSLNLPDFRANEKTFDLLYQTSGRCGRADKKGEVIIQTFNPDNEVLNYVKNNDYNGFYYYEMNIRHKLKYPPYTYIATININGKNYDELSNEANKIRRILDNYLKDDMIIYGPTPASIFKINNILHFQITIKYKNDCKLNQILKNIDEMYIYNKNVNVEITFNPNRF